MMGYIARTIGFKVLSLIEASTLRYTVRVSISLNLQQ